MIVYSRDPRMPFKPTKFDGSKHFLCPRLLWWKLFDILSPCGIIHISSSYCILNKLQISNIFIDLRNCLLSGSIVMSDSWDDSMGDVYHLKENSPLSAKLLAICRWLFFCGGLKFVLDLECNTFVCEVHWVHITRVLKFEIRLHHTLHRYFSVSSQIWKITAQGEEKAEE